MDISHNRIALIQPEAFSGFHHIKELDLSYNKLRTIKSGAFRGCLTLTTLRLRSTGVQYMEAHALDDFVALVDLDLRDNQLVMPNTFARLIKALPGLGIIFAYSSMTFDLFFAVKSMLSKLENLLNIRSKKVNFDAQY